MLLLNIHYVPLYPIVHYVPATSVNTNTNQLTYRNDKKNRKTCHEIIWNTTTYIDASPWYPWTSPTF